MRVVRWAPWLPWLSWLPWLMIGFWPAQGLAQEVGVFPIKSAIPSPMPHEAQPPSPLPEPLPEEPPRPFEQGTMNLGLLIGFSAGVETAFSIGGRFGYFVLPGLEPGLEVDATFGSSQPTTLSLMPYLRWVFLRSYALSPYLKAQGGRWFIFSGNDDLTALGGGGGLVIFLNRMVGLQLEGLVFGLLPVDICQGNCVVTSFGLSLGLYLGGR